MRINLITCYPALSGVKLSVVLNPHTVARYNPVWYTQYWYTLVRYILSWYTKVWHTMTWYNWYTVVWYWVEDQWWVRRGHISVVVLTTGS